MRMIHPRPRRVPPAESDQPPALTGNLETDTDAALDWLWAHPERWLTEATDSADRTPGRAA